MRDLVDRGLGWLGGALLPPRCVLCGAQGQRPALDLCPGCEASLPLAARPLTDTPGVLRRIYAPFAYGTPLDHLVQALKYRGHLATGRVLGTLLAARVQALGLHVDVDVLVPVPLHRERLAERGFNQAAEIARPLARRLQRPLAAGLATRSRATPPQVGLPLAERRRNLVAAFAAAGVTERRVAIVDDVTTTGSTVRELGEVLRAAGAASVDAWCLAVAERQGEATHGPHPYEPR